MKISIQSPDADGRVDPPVRDLLKFLPGYEPGTTGGDVTVVPVTRLDNFRFRKPSTSGRPWVLVDFSEFGWDWRQDTSYLWGVNRLDHPWFKGDEWRRFDDFVCQTPPVAVFQRELLQKDRTNKILPIEYGNHSGPAPRQSRKDFLNRPIEVMFNWGLSHNSRPRLHGDIWRLGPRSGYATCGSWGHLEKAIEESGAHWETKCFGGRLWCAINAPHYERLDIGKVNEWCGKSLITICMNGCGVKTFRHAEVHNSIVALPQDNLAWGVPLEDGVNCLRLESGIGAASILPDRDGREVGKLLERLQDRESLHRIYLHALDAADRLRPQRYLPEYFMQGMAAAQNSPAGSSPAPARRGNPNGRKIGPAAAPAPPAAPIPARVILRPEKQGQGMTFLHSGDYGDVIYAMAIINSIPGRHTLRCVDRPGVTSPFIKRAPFIKPLLEAQPSIEAVECGDGEADVDFSVFRKFHGSLLTLVDSQAIEFQVQAGFYPSADGRQPWLFVEQDDKFKGRVIIARSPRYQNEWFPWSQIISFYGQRLLFVGLSEEHKAFCDQFGNVKHLKVKNFLEMARAIAGAALFIGNQSSPHAVAMSLGVPLIQESSIAQPDCIYKRANAQYVADGACVLPDVMGDGISLTVPRQLQPSLDIPRHFAIPPGFWQYPGLPPHTHYSVLLRLVMQLEHCPETEADQRLAQHNLDRCPEFFAGQTVNPLAVFQEALKKALDKSSPTLNTQPQ